MTEEEYLEVIACYKKEKEDLENLYKKQKEINKEYVDEVEKLQKQIKKLNKQIEYMRCCGNCIYYAIECNEVDIESFNGTLCDNWKVKEIQEEK